MNIIILGLTLWVVCARYMKVEYYAEAPTRIWTTASKGVFSDLIVYTKSKLRNINVDVKQFSGTGQARKTASDGYPKQMIGVSF